MSTKAKTTKRVKSKARGKTRISKKKGFAQPYDAKKFAGSVPSFALVTAEEMKAWRDDH